MKKVLKTIGISALIILLLLIATPFLFQNQIKEAVKTFLNNNVNADIDFDEVNLSLISSFPQANVSVDNLKIINYKPFENQTFAQIKSLSFDISIKELFKNASDEPIVINSIEIDEAFLALKTDKLGNNNYDITKETDSKKTNNDTSNGFVFSIEDYSVNNSDLVYIDETSAMNLNITDLNHSGKGSFSADISELDTQSSATINFSMDSTKYLSNNAIKLDALIDLNLKENTYTFKENKAFINQLPLEFDGFIKLLDEGQQIDISFKNTGSTFKDFLAVIPQSYSQDLDKVQTTGNFKISGLIKGLNSDTTIPNFDISLESDNASFKYPNLPKSVEQISMNAAIKNDTGISDDTYLKINNLKFKIDEDAFKSSATITNLTKNPMVDANIEGVLNLANLSKAYPIKLDNELSGILKGKLHSVFDMKSIEANAYERTKNNGNINLSNFIFSSEDVVNPINISNADILFKPGTVTLQSLEATSGKSDFSATGAIHNLLGFLLSDKNLQGNFKVKSNTFAVSDFMVEGGSEASKTETKESLKIPTFLDCTINAEAKTVLYDNLTLKDVNGKVIIKDEQVTFENLNSSLFDGNLALSGNVTTKNDTPVFKMDLGVNNFDVSQSFNSLELFQTLAPIAKVLQGKLNTTIHLNGTLNDEFSLNLNSLSGNALAEVLTSKIEPKNAAVFDKLNGALTFVDFDELDLKDLKTKLTFENGKVNVKPFNIKYKDITIKVEGSHNFDQSMNYNAVFDVPAKYLGNEVNNLITKIDDKSVNTLTIPVTATIGGSFTSPSVSTDLTSGVSNLTKQLIDIQKQKLLNQGKSEIKDLLGGVLGGTQNTKDTTSTKPKESVKNVLEGILGGTKSNSDTIKTENDPVKNILGGILGGKKKQKDTVN